MCSSIYYLVDFDVFQYLLFQCSHFNLDYVVSRNPLELNLNIK
jgi:hypothetical protein